nr:unnamed protein product [Spirometra erinaceieuropaei]
MYSIFDAISERSKVYKVETIGDSYMIASGLPSVTKYHSAHIAETVLDILQKTRRKLFWPVMKGETEKRPVRLYVGCHTGAVVAGVVGLHSPRYCLFGNTVNVASRMMSHGIVSC